MKGNDWNLEITAPPELHEPIQELFDAISWKLKHAESSSAHPTYTDEELQMMQDLESAEIEKAYQLGYEEGKKVTQPEYKPVTTEDFAKTMSENTLYQYMAWHGEALALMKEQGFVICKKAM